MAKFVYFFGEGSRDLKPLLGGKGAELGEMTRIGIPVPPGFTITTEACAKFYENKMRWPEGLDKEIQANLKKLELATKKKLGDESSPLLVSVRSGAAVSMPGMMDTILNLGLNDKTVEVVAKKTNNPRFAYDSYRRFIQMFGDVVLGVEHSEFESILRKAKETKGVDYDTGLDAADLRKVVSEYKKLVRKTTGKDFPQGVQEQLSLSINAVFNSWNNDRAIAYRRLNDIKGLLGTAVNIQSMVFGNMGDSSGTGVCFTRDPSTGQNEFYGEYLMNAQGEDVVAGIRTPKHLSDLKKQDHKLYAELCKLREKLEQHYKDMQDIEFTIQEGTLYLLQTRTGKRTAQAAVKIAVDMVKEKLIDEKTAILRVEPNSLNKLLHKQIDPIAKAKSEVLCKGLPASPGAAVGRIVFDADAAVASKQKGEKCILVRTETSPEDIIGMDAAEGILTARGGMTSHAAVVARGMGKCCVAGCSDCVIDEHKKTLSINISSKKSLVCLKDGDYLTLDGSTGEVVKGQLPLVDPELSGDFGILMQWADKYRTLGVRTNADIPRDVKKAIEFGAEGIGLCRTEHMFFEGERIIAIREMILASDLEGRKKALNKLIKFQRDDFKGIFEALNGKPATIRLLDPPLHEFLPKEDSEIKAVAKELRVKEDAIREKIAELHEQNPMLGHRGCRLGISFPEITEMQTRAIIEAAIEVKQKKIDVKPEIMIPLVGHFKELTHQKDVVDKTAEFVMKEKGVKISYQVGTMIEVPRGALTADELAHHAEFFSFGTNDLTQMGCGFSRDDAGRFLKDYVALGIFDKDPFQSLDQEGVGQLIRIGIEKGRAVKPGLKVGICGEHGGDPSSIEFCHRVGMNYVSCSPYRVPVARLAAAQAALKYGVSSFLSIPTIFSKPHLKDKRGSKRKK